MSFSPPASPGWRGWAATACTPRRPSSRQVPRRRSSPGGEMTFRAARLPRWLRRVWGLGGRVGRPGPTAPNRCATRKNADSRGVARARAGAAVAVVKAGSAGGCLLADGRSTHVPAMDVQVADSTGAGDAFCGGLAAGVARGLAVREAVGLGAAVAGTAITGSGSLRLLQSGHDRAAIAEAGRRLAAAPTEIRSPPPRPRHGRGAAAAPPPPPAPPPA